MAKAQAAPDDQEDDAPAPKSVALPPISSAVSKILTEAGISPAQQQRINATQDAADAASHKAYTSVQDTSAKMKAINAQPLPPMPADADTKLPALPGKFQAPPQKDPKHIFVELLPVLAMLGGALVKNNAVASLKAATAAMQAVKDNNAEALKKAHDEWSDNMDYAIKASEHQAAQIKLILDDRHSAVEDRMAQLQALSAATNNDVLGATVANGDFDRAWKMSEGLSKTALALKQYKLEQERLNHEQNDPKRRAFNDFVEQYKREHGGQSPPADAEAKFITSTSGFSSRAAQGMQSAFYRLPVVHNYQVIQGMWPRLQSAIDQIKSDPKMKYDQSLQLEALDTFIQMANGGRQVTESQINAYAHQPGYLGWAAKQYASVKAGQFLTTQQVDSLLHQGIELQKHSEDALGPVVKDQISMANARGLDPAEIIPPSLLDKYSDDSSPPQAGATDQGSEQPAPTQDAIAYLKSHPDTKDQFDEFYGAGLAQRVLGASPPVSSQHRY